MTHRNTKGCVVNAGVSSEGWDMIQKVFLWKMHFGQANVGEGQRMEEPAPVGTEPY